MYINDYISNIKNVQTELSDVFSLGCVFYYTLTNGKYLHSRENAKNYNGFELQINIANDVKKSEAEQELELHCKNFQF